MCARVRARRDGARTGTENRESAAIKRVWRAIVAPLARQRQRDERSGPGGPRAHAAIALRPCAIARVSRTPARAVCPPVLRTGGHTGKAHTYLTRCKFRNWKVPLLHSPIQDTEPESSSRKLVGALHADCTAFGVRWSCGTVGRREREREEAEECER